MNPSRILDVEAGTPLKVKDSSSNNNNRLTALKSLGNATPHGKQKAALAGGAVATTGTTAQPAKAPC